MASKGSDEQKTAQPATESKPKEGAGAPAADTTPQGERSKEKAPVIPKPGEAGKEDSGTTVPKQQYINLQKAHTELRKEFEALQGRVQGMNLDPLMQSMALIRTGLEEKTLEDQMWRIDQAVDAGNLEGANRLAERELHRQLAGLGLTPETAPPQVMKGPDAVGKLHNLMIYRSFLTAQQQQRPAQQVPNPGAGNPTPAPGNEPEKIGGKTLEELKALWSKEAGILNIVKAQPEGIPSNLDGVTDPSILIREGVRRAHEPED